MTKRQRDIVLTLAVWILGLCAAAMGNVAYEHWRAGLVAAELQKLSK